MRGFLKGKLKTRDSSSKRHNEDDNLPSPTSRVAKWSDLKNEIFGEILLEHYIQGNIIDGVVRRDKWDEIVDTVNRRLGTNYNRDVITTRYKNMKSDFRVLHGLVNRSGWGWDEEKHLPVATDEIWAELIKEDRNMNRYRRNPFHQYNIFAQICALNVAVGTNAIATNPSDVQEANHFENTESTNDLYGEDELLMRHGVSFVDNPTEDMPANDDVIRLERRPSKRASVEKLTTHRKGKKRSKDQDELKAVLSQNAESIDGMRQTINKFNPFTIEDCMKKLSSIPNMSVEAILACLDIFKNNPDSKTIFMNLEDEILRKWIEQTVADDHRYSTSSVWI